MPWAHGWLCHGLVNPARYTIFTIIIPVSESSTSGMCSRFAPMYSTGNPCHSAVVVSTTVSSTGSAVVGMRTPASGSGCDRGAGGNLLASGRQLAGRERRHHRRRAGGHGELGVDVLQVGVDRLRRDAQPAADRGVGQPVGDQVEDGPFPRGEQAGRRGSGRRAGAGRGGGEGGAARAPAAAGTASPAAGGSRPASACARSGAVLWRLSVRAGAA